MISYLSYNILYLYYIILKYIEWLRNTVSKCNRFPFHSHIRPPWSHRRQAGQVRGLGLWDQVWNHHPKFATGFRGRWSWVYDVLWSCFLAETLAIYAIWDPDSSGFQKKARRNLHKNNFQEGNKMNNSQHFRQALAPSFFSVARLSAAPNKVRVKLWKCPFHETRGQMPVSPKGPFHSTAIVANHHVSSTSCSETAKCLGTAQNLKIMLPSKLHRMWTG